MTMPPSHSGTYFVEDMYTDEEIVRLGKQDRQVTKAMGGVLAKALKPEAFRQVLDIACGVGHWAIDVALAFPEVSLIGIDINPRMVAVANEQAATCNLQARVKFMAMDALQSLRFSDFSFDLVNIRFASGFIRHWEWQRLLSEVRRVMRPGGVLRVTDEKIMRKSNSQAELQFCQALQCALDRSGRLFRNESNGLVSHLARLFTHQGFQDVWEQEHIIQFQARTRETRSHVENTLYLLRLLRPFLEHWGCLPDNYADLPREIQADAGRSNYASQWHLLTVWGSRAET